MPLLGIIASGYASAPAGPSLPGDPTGLTATATGTSTIDLAWNNVADETGFRIERSPDGVGSWVTAGSVGVDVLAFTDTGLSAGVTYYYRVYAFNVQGDSLNPSNVDSATTTSTITNFGVTLDAMAGGTQAITVPGNGPCVAAVTFASGRTATGAAAEDATIGMGFHGMSTSGYAVAAGFQNGAPASATQHRSLSSAFTALYDYDDVGLASGAFNGSTTDGFTATWPVAPAAGYQMVTALISGIQNAAHGEVPTPDSVTPDLGFPPNAMLAIMPSASNFGGTSQNVRWCWGGATGAEQAYLGFEARNNNASQLQMGQCSASYCIAKLNQSSINWEASVAFEGNTLNFTKAGTGSTSAIGYLAINTGTAPCTVKMIQIAASAGVQNFPMGFPLSGVILVTSMFPALDVKYDAGEHGGFGYYISDGTNTYGVGIWSEQAGGTSNTGMFVNDDGNVRSYTDAGVLDSVAALSFSGNDLSLNFSDAPSAIQQWWVMGIG